MDKPVKLNRDFYLRDDVVQISRELLGKVLCTQFSGVLTKTIITETEAYAGTTDKASHAYGNKRTARTEVMYSEGGIAYVYLCYGIHHLFNVVTNKMNTPHAVLVRAGKPLQGTQHMLERRNKPMADHTLSGGPGTVAQAMGIRTEHSGMDLLGNVLWLEDHGISPTGNQITSGPRIGIDYAEEDALLPYRFIAKF